MKDLLLLMVLVVLMSADRLMVVRSGNRWLTEERSIETVHRREVMLGLARAARTRLDYAGALRLLDDAARLDPDSVEPLVERGLIFLDAEDLVRARAFFDAALRINASNTGAMIGLAGVELFERDHPGAEARLRLLLTRDPRNGAAHGLLARVLLENNRTGEAAAEAQRAIALDPRDVEALTTLAFVKARERKPAEVRALARQAVLLDGFNAAARRLLSQYLDGKAGYERRVADAARKLYERGRALKQQGRIAEAVTELEAAIALEPSYSQALLALGDAWLKKGYYERACTAARLAESIDADSALAQLMLSYAYRGMKERARIEIGAPDFSAMFDSRPAPSAFALTGEIFPDYESLSARGRAVIDYAVAPLAGCLPKLARAGARHYLLAYDQRPSEIRGLRVSAGEKTLDGRYSDSIRGAGGRVTVSGIEYLETAASCAANIVAHEFAHQVHLTAMSKAELRTIHNLYERARREGRVLDYYAAENELEYFAQGYEAFISEYKRPSAGVTARHTNRELLMRDPDLHSFFVKRCWTHPDLALADAGFLAKSSCLTGNIVACDYPALELSGP
ncbi:MAG: tetratricopeptide repeat protein [Blastocatellia bacterium]